MFLVFGWANKAIGSQMTDIACSNCESPLAVVGLQNFFRLFFIPFIPLSKERVMVCTNCGAQFPVESLKIDPSTLPQFKTPWWGYLGLLIMGGFLAFGILGIIIT